MIIYIDTCCYCRPYDNRVHITQQRVRLEVNAIIDIVRLCGTSGIPIFGSAALSVEINDIGDYGKRERVRDFYYEVITEELELTDSIVFRAQKLTTHGIGGFDSYHIAFAEAAGANYLLTTDDRFERTADKLDIKTKVVNPITFLEEYLLWRLS